MNIRHFLILPLLLCLGSVADSSEIDECPGNLLNLMGVLKLSLKLPDFVGSPQNPPN